MKTKIHGYFLCYNEEHILPHLLRHYSFCEKIYILDNYSTDRSHEIINSFPNTEIIPYDSNGEVRDDIYLKLKNNVWKQSRGIADYVIVGDADEFLYHQNLPEFIDKSKDIEYDIFRPKGYQMIGDEDLELTPEDSITEKVTEGIEADYMGKLMMFNPNSVIEMNYAPGCHIANPIGDNIKYYNGDELKMLHYKYLGLKDFIPKQRLRGERLSKFNKFYQLGMYYLYTEEKHTEEYKTFIKNRKKIL